MQPTRVDRCDNCGSVLVQRTLEQNDKFHALVQDIADQKQWMGELRPVPVWKQLISAAFERAQGRHMEMLPAIDGHGVDVVYWSSARRGKKSMSELIEFTTAWAIDNNIKLRNEEQAFSPGS
jgi:hypothetical protein